MKIRPNVLHACLPLTNFMGSVAGRLSRVPLIVTSRRALGTHQDRHKGWRFFDSAAILFSKWVTVNSHAVKEDTMKRDHADPSKLILIYNGVDPFPFESTISTRAEMRRELEINFHERVIIVVANLIPYKGHADLLEAASMVLKQIPETIFLLVGEDRGIQKNLERQAIALRILDRVRLMGRRQDVPQILAASDLSVLPSHEEGFSNVILESMAAGLPVVATCVGGNPEAVVDGVTGWLVPPRNPKALAAKMIDLLNNPAKARIWGERGRRRVKEHFATERMVAKHLKLYQSASETAAQRNL